MIEDFALESAGRRKTPSNEWQVSKILCHNSLAKNWQLLRKSRIILVEHTPHDVFVYLVDAFIEHVPMFAPLGETDGRGFGRQTPCKRD